MYNGVFPIVMNIEANREWIRNGDQGFLVPTNNPQVLAEKVIEILGNKTLREEVANKNIETVRRNASDEDIIDRLIENYQKIIQSGLKERM